MASNRTPIRPKDILYPNRILGNLIDDYISGKLTDYAVFFKAVVIKIDHIGGKLSGPGTKKPNDFANPPNSIQARIINKDKFKSDEDLSVFWPMFSHDVMPVKEGEHVYVLFEIPNEEVNGIWMCRSPEPKGINNPNLALGSTKYKDTHGPIGLDQAVANTPNQISAPALSEDFVVEEVKPYISKTGDRVIQGSNNTIIVMGDGGKSGTGTISIVTGRDDKIDQDSVQAIIQISSDSSGPMITIKTKGKVMIEGQEIQVGQGATEAAVLGNKLLDYLTSVVVNTPAGPGKLVPPTPLLISTKVKIAR